MSKRLIAPRQDERVRLRLLERADLPRTLAWRNQEHIRRWFFFSDPLTPDQHAAWFEQYQQRDDDFVFIIEDVQAGGAPVGQVALYHIDWPTRRAEFGRLMMGEASAAGKGLARAATRLVLRIAWEDLALGEVYLEVFANNAAAIAVYEKVGFRLAERDEQVWKMSIRSDGL
jgi:diamine N-acetyltransferase